MVWIGWSPEIRNGKVVLCKIGVVRQMRQEFQCDDCDEVFYSTIGYKLHLENCKGTKAWIEYDNFSQRLGYSGFQYLY